MITFQQRIGYQFSDITLLEQALTHKSFHNEQSEGSSLGHNERLEFLGDAVLDLVLSDSLMKAFPEATEGELSKARASLVNETVLAELAKSFDMQRLMRLGKGEILTKGAEKPRLLASMFEAFVGAYYLDAGYEKAFEFIKGVFQPWLEQMDPKKGYSTDYKTRLQEMTQERFKCTPNYKIVDESGPDHEKIFVVEVSINKEHSFTGEGKSKKQAEQLAAEKALEELF